MKSYRNILQKSLIDFDEYEIIKYLYRDDFNVVLDHKLIHDQNYDGRFLCFYKHEVDDSILVASDYYSIKRRYTCFSFNDLLKKKMSLEAFKAWCQIIRAKRVLGEY